MSVTGGLVCENHHHGTTTQSSLEITPFWKSLSPPHLNHLTQQKQLYVVGVAVCVFIYQLVVSPHVDVTMTSTRVAEDSGRSPGGSYKGGMPMKLAESTRTHSSDQDALSPARAIGPSVDVRS